MESWRDDFDLSINSYFDHTSRGPGRHPLETGAAACERLLSRTGLPPEIELATRRNATWYLPRLEELVPLRHSHRVNFFNPSIAISPDGEIKMILRSSNYTITEEGTYQIDDPDDVIRTTNYLATMKGQMIDHVERIEDDHLRIDPPPFPVSGFEDARLYYLHGWEFSATVRDRTSRGICQMVRCSLEGVDIFHMDILSGHRRHEKNWMPVCVTEPGESLRFLYSCYPTTVRLSVMDQGTWFKAPYIARFFRGGTQVIRHRDGWLALVHESVDFESPPIRVYSHRLVEFDRQLRLTRVSLPFCFHKRGIEFAAGMIILEDDLIISYGVDDAEAHLARVPLKDMLSLLRDPLSEEPYERRGKTATPIQTNVMET